MGKNPAFQFYPGDWMKDPQLSLCSPSTRGIWIDLLCAMHEMGRDCALCGTAEQLARLARCNPSEIAQALSELQATGAAEIKEESGSFRVMSRRMTRDARSREEWRLQKTGQRVRKMSGKCPAVSSSSSSSTHTPPAAPVRVCDSPPGTKEPAKRNAEPQDDALYDFEARLSPEAQEARAGLESSWRTFREQSGLAPAIDGNARRGLDILSLAVLRGDFTMSDAADAMRRFLKDQKTDTKLSGYGLRGMAENVSRWLPSQAPTRAPAPPPVAGPAPPAPDAAKLSELLERAEAQGDQNRASQIRKLLESMEAKACG